VIVSERLLDNAALAFHRRDDDDRAAVVSELVEESRQWHHARAQRGRQLVQHAAKLDVANSPEGAHLLHPRLQGRVQPTIDLLQVVGARAHGADREHEANRLQAGGVRDECGGDRLAVGADLGALEEGLPKRADLMLADLVVGGNPDRAGWAIGQVGQPACRARGQQQETADKQRTTAPCSDRSIFHAPLLELETRQGLP
jgi:hypothetical protein